MASRTDASSGRRFRLKGCRVVVTGKFQNKSRLDVQLLVIKHGCDLRRDVSQRTSFILAGIRPGVTKMKLAAKFKIPIYGLKDFLKKDFLAKS